MSESRQGNGATRTEDRPSQRAGDRGPPTRGVRPQRGRTAPAACSPAVLQTAAVSSHHRHSDHRGDRDRRPVVAARPSIPDHRRRIRRRRHDAGQPVRGGTHRGSSRRAQSGRPARLRAGDARYAGVRERWRRRRPRWCRRRRPCDRRTTTPARWRRMSVRPRRRSRPPRPKPARAHDEAHALSNLPPGATTQQQLINLRATAESAGRAAPSGPQEDRGRGSPGSSRHSHRSPSPTPRSTRPRPC